MSNLLDDYIPKREAADQLGCSTRTLDRYENEPDGLPSVRVAGRTFYLIEDLKAFIAKRKRFPNPREASA